MNYGISSKCHSALSEVCLFGNCILRMCRGFVFCISLGETCSWENCHRYRNIAYGTQKRIGKREVNLVFLLQIVLQAWGKFYSIPRIRLALANCTLTKPRINTLDKGLLKGGQRLTITRCNELLQLALMTYHNSLNRVTITLYDDLW